MSGSDKDTVFMKQALKLAEKGFGRVEPNPAVGCVIVKGGGAIGTGWHREFGGAHAEINALENCRKRGHDPGGSTIYITLEPCCHAGKTPPCAEALIEAAPSRVVIAVGDPSPHAAGAGIRRLEQAGIRVDTGICREETARLNGPFLKYAATGRCWVTVKWAQSIDGRIGWVSGGRRWISSEASRRDVHALRRRSQAIVAGINTVRRDNPLLTARPPGRVQPLRVVLDARMEIPMRSRLFKTVDQAPVIIAASRSAARDDRDKVQKIKDRGAEVLPLATGVDRLDLRGLLDELGSRGVQRVLVEGGATVIGSFLRRRLADEAVVYIAPLILGSKGIHAEGLEKAGLSFLRDVEYKCFGEDARITGLVAHRAVMNDEKG
jgi:diaminohydroxyphosphoribosylaminopyrimidine deaminase/5-amino-6-(5-phosphoribosylamino)uracil reductase